MHHVSLALCTPPWLFKGKKDRLGKSQLSYTDRWDADGDADGMAQVSDEKQLQLPHPPSTSWEKPASWERSQHPGRRGEHHSLWCINLWIIHTNAVTRLKVDPLHIYHASWLPMDPDHVCITPWLIVRFTSPFRNLIVHQLFDKIRRWLKYHSKSASEHSPTNIGTNNNVLRG